MTERTFRLLGAVRSEELCSDDWGITRVESVPGGRPADGVEGAHLLHVYQHESSPFLPEVEPDFVLRPAGARGVTIKLFILDK